jgi:hypothetical protein
LKIKIINKKKYHLDLYVLDKNHLILKYFIYVKKMIQKNYSIININNYILMILLLKVQLF